MKEKDKGQKNSMIRASKDFEKAWMICHNPGRYPDREVLKAAKFLKEQIPKFQSLVFLEKDGDDPAVSHWELELVMQGVYHQKHPDIFIPNIN